MTWPLSDRTPSAVGNQQRVAPAPQLRPEFAGARRVLR